ncbi:MAG: putative antiholin [Prokaryotic dsDNA virus sp.]|nr:MAG: putative antiholin [Prokaryotic dsDNA virus sp.]|tara:strand:+ start:40406 stop:40735 length:330 start_codon:yes stop_codon:yes gene_type:complete
MPQNKLSILEAIAFALFAGVGGALSYLLRTLSVNVKPSFIKGLVEALSSAFVGVLAMLACKGAGIDWYWSGVIVGVFGWIGAETSIVILSKCIRSKFGISTNNDKDGKS